MGGWVRILHGIPWAGLGALGTWVAIELWGYLRLQGYACSPGSARVWLNRLKRELSQGLKGPRAGFAQNWQIVRVRRTLQARRAGVLASPIFRAPGNSKVLTACLVSTKTCTSTISHETHTRLEFLSTSLRSSPVGCEIPEGQCSFVVTSVSTAPST